MKKVILVIAVILTASAAGFSQNADSPAVMYRLDSIIIEREGLPSSKETYLYNEYGKEILTTHFSWNETNNEWEESGKEEYTYDDNNNLIMWIPYSRDGDWKKDYKSEYTYDSNNNQTMCIYSRLDKETKNWIGKEKRESMYDNKGNKTTYTRYDWDETTNNLSEYSKSEMTYNDKNNLTMLISYDWDNKINDWVIDEKIEYTYDNNGKKIIEISYDWDDKTNNWKISDNKRKFAYDNNGNQIMDINSSFKDESAYDNNGNRTIFTTYYWNKATHNWVKDFKEESTYDDNGNQIMSIAYFRDERRKSKYEYLFDLSYLKTDLIIPNSTDLYIGINMPTRIISYEWTGTEWVQENITTYYWSEKKITIDNKK